MRAVPCAAASAASRRRPAWSDDVRRNAAAAAFGDPRFQPLTAAEWAGSAGRGLAARHARSRCRACAPGPTRCRAAAAACRRRDPGMARPAGRPSCRRSGRQLPRAAATSCAALLRKAGLPARLLGRRPEAVALPRAALRGRSAGRPAMKTPYSESVRPALVAPAGRRPHAVRPLPARLPAARRPARPVLRARAPGRRDGAHHLRPQFGLLRRPDREEAAQPLPTRQPVLSLRHRRLQPGLQVLPELGHLQEPRDGPPAWTRPRPQRIAEAARRRPAAAAWPSPTTTR